MDELVYVVLITLLACIGGIVFYTNAFKVLVFKELKGGGVLTGQLKRGESCAMLPNPKGLNTFTIDLKKGRLRLNHSSYNPDGSTWSLPPAKGKQQHFDMVGTGTYNITVFIGESYEMTDRIELVNPEKWVVAEFSYECKCSYDISEMGNIIVET